MTAGSRVKTTSGPWLQAGDYQSTVGQWLGFGSFPAGVCMTVGSAPICQSNRLPHWLVSSTGQCVSHGF